MNSTPNTVQFKKITQNRIKCLKDWTVWCNAYFSAWWKNVTDESAFRL